MSDEKRETKEMPDKDKAATDQDKTREKPQDADQGYAFKDWASI